MVAADGGGGACVGVLVGGTGVGGTDVGIFVGALVGVFVAVGVLVGVGVFVGLSVTVGVSVSVGIGVTVWSVEEDTVKALGKVTTCPSGLLSVRS